MSDIIILDWEYEKKQKKISGLSLDGINTWFLKAQKIRLKDKVVFYRLLATMVNSGITVLRAVRILKNQQKNKQIQLVQQEIIDSIQSGNNLSHALRMNPRSFNESEIAMIESGETTGKLNDSLMELATQVEKLSSLSKKLRWALIYPAMIMVVMFGVVFVIMVKVVPNLISIFADVGGDLPKPTQMLIATSDFFVTYWYLLLLVPFACISAFSLLRMHPVGKYHTDKMRLYIPIIGPLTKKVILSKFARLFATLLGNGITITEALRIISSALGNEVYKQRMMLLREDVQKGTKIGESLEDDPLFPDMLVQMIMIGEETAKLDSIIIKVADFYDEEVDTAVTAINKTLEPIIIVIMAIVVGFIAYAVMTPIMQLSDVITQ